MKFLNSPDVPAGDTSGEAVNFAQLDALAKSDTLAGMMGGVLYFQDPRVGTGAAVWTGANRGVAMRVAKGGVITKIGMDVAVSSGNISVAVYDTTGSGRSAAPNNRLATSGAVACPAVGYQEVSLGGSVTVPDGGWLYMSCDNVTASFIRQAASGISANGLLAGLTVAQAIGHPAPATFTGTTLNIYFPVLLGIP